MDQELLAAVQSALAVQYGAESQHATRAMRRAADRTLLSLRRAEPRSAMQICVHLLEGTDQAAAIFAAQTVAHLCRFVEPETTWAAALLGLLHAAVDARLARSIQTPLSLAVCALIARKRGAWAANELVGAICEQLNASTSAASLIAALRLLSLLPEEMSSDQLALPEIHLEEFSDELQNGAAPHLVELCTQALSMGGQDPGLAAASLHCLSVWTSSELLPWPVLTPAMTIAMNATAAPLTAACAPLTEASVAQLSAGCSLLTAAASIHPDLEMADALIPAALTLREGFTAVSATAAAGQCDSFVESAAGALSSLFSDIGSSYREHVGRHPELLESLLHAAGHVCPEVSIAALGFWAVAGSTVLSMHAAATQPLLSALISACEYPRDMGDRDGDYCEQKEEVRQNARRVVAGALLSPSATSTGMAPHVLEGTAWLIELAATEAHTLTTTPDPLGQLSTPPSPPPSNDTLPWTRLEAALHILGAIATGLSTTQEPSAKQLMHANTTKTLISTLPILPARRALWREAAITSSELGLSLDLSNQEASSLLLACCTAAARTLQVEEFGGNSSDDEPFEFVKPHNDDSGGVTVHAGASALWRLCGGSAAVASSLAQASGVFDGVLRAQQQAYSSGSSQVKGDHLLKVACALARSSASLADERLQQIAAPMINLLRSAAQQATTAGNLAAASPIATAAFEQLCILARHAGAVQPGVLGLLASEWTTIRGLTLTLAKEESPLHKACALLSIAMRSCDGSVRQLLEASAAVSIELLRVASAGSRPPPCVLLPLAAAIRRAYNIVEDGATAAAASPPELVDAAMESGLVGWVEACLSSYLPSLATPTQPSGIGSDDAPIDLTDDGDEAIGNVCMVLSACVRSSSARLVGLAATHGLPLLCGSAGGLRVMERDAGKSALAFTRHLLSCNDATVQSQLGGEGGPLIALHLLNGAGGAMPPYLLDEIGLTCKAMYTVHAEAAANWMHQAVNSPNFSHPHVTGPQASVPTGGNRSTVLTNYAQVLGYLAGHGAWEYFNTVLARGVMVSEGADQGDAEE